MRPRKSYAMTGKMRTRMSRKISRQRKRIRRYGIKRKINIRIPCQNILNTSLISASNHTAAPMPAFIVSSSSSASMVPPPPAAAFQPALKILKRPVNNRTNSSPSPSVPKESIEEREARYQAARDRIFGENASSGSVSSEASTVQLSSKNDNTVIRNPRGPDDTNTAPSKGFDSRIKTPKTASQDSLPVVLYDVTCILCVLCVTYIFSSMNFFLTRTNDCNRQISKSKQTFNSLHPCGDRNTIIWIVCRI